MNQDSYCPTVIGIDPGLHLTGYGIVQQLSNQFIAQDYGVIRLPASMPIEQKLCTIEESLRQLLLQYCIEAIAVETQYVCKNVSSAMKLGMVRGIVLALAAKVGVSIAQYAPTRIKKAVVGRGLASKQQMQAMVMTRLQLAQEPPEDAADALAMALCHLQNPNLGRLDEL